MIPIGLPSLEFVLIRLACLAATLIWLAWLLRLGFSKTARLRLRSWRGLLFLILSAICGYSIWSVYDFNRHLAAYRAEQQALYHRTLAAPQNLGGIDLPAATTLRLALAHQPASFYLAEFAQPVAISGVDALRAERYIAVQTDADYKTSGFSVENLRLTGIGQSRQSGWICDATLPIVFLTHADGRIDRFENCTAATGNLVDGQPLPQGAEIIASQGRVFLNGSIGTDRWQIHLPSDARFTAQGISQTGGALWLDAARNVIDRVIPQDG